MNNDTNNLKHVEVPMKVFLDEDLSSTSKLLIGFINTLSKQKGYCFASNKHFSKHMKISRRTVTSSLTSLRKKNYIRDEYVNNKRRIYLANIF